MKNSTLKRRRTHEDRISNLPSSLIGHILSFLPTKEAVATSVLSTRWKQCWTFITSLYLDDYLLLQYLPSSNTDNDDNASQLQDEFQEFVYRVLLIGKFSCIDTFRLHCVGTYHDRCVSAWIASALTCKLQELDIRIPRVRCSLLPRELFTCKTLVKLKLGLEIYLNVPRLVSLPCLKVVELAWVMFSDEDSINRFLGGCPMLDCLKMTKCASRNVKHIKICNPLLTSLHLTFVRYGYDHSEEMFGAEEPHTLRFLFDTPSLLHIFVQDYVQEAYVFENLPKKLKTARIGIRGNRHPHVIGDLLNGISAVQKLHFHTELEGIDGGHHLPIFGNMKDFIYVLNHFAKFGTLFNMLERSPQLLFLRTTFDFNHNAPFVYIDAGMRYLPKLELPPHVPECLFHLKIIEIVNFHGLRCEVELVEYFLKNALVLEKLSISWTVGYMDECMWIGEELRFLPRASRFCQIQFV